MVTDNMLRARYLRSVEGVVEELRTCANEAWPFVLDRQRELSKLGPICLVAVSWIDGEPMSISIAVVPEDAAGEA